MNQIHVTETIFLDDNRDGKRYYTFSLPLAIGAGYRQVTSYNAFFHSSPRVGTRTKRAPNWTDKRLFYATIGSDPIFDAEAGDPTPYADIYAFFAAIGYDYRRKRYTSGERMRRVLLQNP
jgi:hypothetical protein